MAEENIRLETKGEVLLFEKSTLRLVSFQPKSVPQEFIASESGHPVFQLGFYDKKNRYRLLTSFDAGKTEVSESPSGKGWTACFQELAGLPLTVWCSVEADPEERFARWKVRVDNQAGLRIADMQYPFLVCRYDLGGEERTESIVLPHGYGSGQLLTGDLRYGGSITNHRLRPDSYKAWEFCSREWDCNHYPGMQYAQYMAYYNDRAGFYVACNDTEGGLKRFLALHREPGIRFGISHVGDWPQNGSRTLEYDVLTTSFTGDWYDATDIYREWSLQQKWFLPLWKKKNVPAWLLDSPVYVTIRPGGVLDCGPPTPVEEFLPYEKCIPLLEKLSDAVDSPLAVILMGWEKVGPWVYPDCFPPLGGEESMRHFIQLAKEHGWHTGSFCSGTRYAYDHDWSGYDGRDYLDQIDAWSGICREADGSYRRERWDESFRSSYLGCVGSERMRRTCLEIVSRLVDWGMESIQFLDQNNGCTAFPCFSSEHGHPSLPGRWMNQAMQRLVADMQDVAGKRGIHTVVHSAESGLNETSLPLFQETELRVNPIGYGNDRIPIYQYLFHECVVLQGMMGNAPEPYHLVVRNALNCVWGAIPGGVMRGDGTLLDQDTDNWALWEPHVEDNKAALRMIRSVNALRRTEGKPFLVFGRMQRPAEVSGIPTVEWEYQSRHRSLPAVFHAVWQSPDRRIGVVLANWTAVPQRVCIRDQRLQEKAGVVFESADTIRKREIPNLGDTEVEIPAHGCVLLCSLSDSGDADGGTR